MVSNEAKRTKCKQIIGHPKAGRACSRRALHGEYCSAHADQTYFARVSHRVGVSKGKLDEITAALADEMTWEQVHAFNREAARGQLYEDAGGYFVRFIAKLFGARGRYDDLDINRRALKAVFKEPTHD